MWGGGVLQGTGLNRYINCSFARRGHQLRVRTSSTQYHFKISNICDSQNWLKKKKLILKHPWCLESFIHRMICRKKDYVFETFSLPSLLADGREHSSHWQAQPFANRLTPLIQKFYLQKTIKRAELHWSHLTHPFILSFTIVFNGQGWHLLIFNTWTPSQNENVKSHWFAMTLSFHFLPSGQYSAFSSFIAVHPSATRGKIYILRC